MQVTFNAFAYKYDWHDMADIESGDQMPSIWDFEDETTTKIGTAVVTVTLFPKAEIHTQELAILNEKLQAVRAENHVRENAILDRISKITAIGHEVAE
jgi:hypothetical protein